ncbi:hypothetical protein D9758_010342 [Tetrapyrgos nigripes]|uniref:Autophagy-related protein 27 n=1 Tax=Tetrapyrgos nigripes TaxID=182062 RepID=A0A8H5FVK2_9AGAR|nr:hypothetical protein D9758_010342 [Tetrapyrgos nigripes]
MSASMHFIVHLLLCLLLTLQHAAGAILKSPVEAQAAEQDQPCTFTIKAFKYDLCPLFHSLDAPFKIVKEEDTPPTITRKTYEIGLKSALKRDKTLPAESQCSDGTRICLIVSFTRPDRPSVPSQILQVIPIATTKDLTPKPKIGEKSHADDEHSPLLVTLHGGLYTNLRQKATFIFRCKPDSVEPSKPTIAWSFNGTHAFNWETQHACHEFVKPSPSTGDDETPDEPPDLPPADPDNDNESESGSGSGQPATATGHVSFLALLWCVVLVVLFLCTLSYLGVFSFRRTTRYLVRPLRTSSLGGPSASRLLRWAQQAGYTQENEYDDEYDYDNDDDGPGRSGSQFDSAFMNGEEIPLTPSPRKGTFGSEITTYGTGKAWGERERERERSSDHARS